MPANRIAIGNGSCDILLAAGDALLEPGAEVVYAWPSFSVYPHLAAASGATRHRGPARRRRTSTTSTKMREEITVATRLVIVCNPNNPTSTALPLEEIAAFVADVPPHVAVILDEAYMRVQHPAGPRRVDRRCSSSTRTSCCCARSRKVYGLCGLRVGFALCGSEDFRTAVDQVRQPFFCNAAAQAAALEALNHQDEVTRRVERNLAERIGLEDGLRRLGMEPAESQANFVWFDLPAGEDDEPAEVERDVLAGPRPARHPRARRRLAGPRRRAARHGRHRGGERALPRRARRARRDSALNPWPRAADAGTTDASRHALRTGQLASFTFAAYSYAGAASRSAWRFL